MEKEYRKIIVIGCSGSGKSTFSKKLSEKTGLPLYYLDMLYWNDDWTHISREEFREKQKEIMKGGEWILDGNFRGTVETRLKRCELAYFLDFPVEVCLDGIKERVGKRREDMPCVATKLDEELVEFVKNFPGDCRPMILELFEKYPNVKVVAFKSRKEADDYLEHIPSEIYGNHI